MKQSPNNNFANSFHLHILSKLCGVVLLFFTFSVQARDVFAADSLLREARQHNVPDSLRFYQLLEAARIYAQPDIFLEKRNTVDSIIREALYIALANDWEKQLLGMLSANGVNERNQAQYPLSIYWHQKQLKIADSLGFINDKMLAFNNLGVVHRRIDNYRQANDYHLSALAIASEINDEKAYVIAANGLGNIQYILGNYEEALRRFRECLKFEQQKNDLQGVAINLNNIGNVFFKKGEVTKALEYYLLSLEVNREAGSERGVAICYNDLGNVYKYRKEYPKARNYYLLSLELNESIGEKYYLATSYINVAELYILEKNFDQALNYLERGIATAEQTSALALLGQAYDLMYIINKERGDYSMALEFFERASAISDSILNNTISRTVIQMQTLFDRERSESQIALLRHQKELAELQMRDQKLINWIGMSALIILMISLLVGLYVIRLKNHSNVQLQSQNDEIEKAQQELSLYAEKLLLAKEEAEKHNRLKSQFLANMSHEIRTPMNSIIGFTDILENVIDDPQKRSYLESIRSSGRNLLLLINDILDLSKIEADKLKIENTPLDLRVLMQEIKQLFSLQLDEKFLSFDVYVDETLPKLVFLSETSMRQILFNLVGNAIKFTPQGGIQLRLLVSESKKPMAINIQLAVKDSGIGIDPEGVDKIFEAFYQHHTDSSRYRGTGLGLAITQRLVNAMHGTITVDSMLNKGTTFKITFNDVLVIKEVETAEQTPEELRSEKINEFPVVFLVSDNIFYIQLVKEMALVHGLRFEVVASSFKLFKNFNQQATACVLVDLDCFVPKDKTWLVGIMQKKGLQTVLIGNSNLMSALQIKHDLLFELPAQQELLQRFLENLANRNFDFHPSGSRQVVMPEALNIQQKDDLKVLNSLWEKAQSSNFMVDAQRFAEMGLVISKKYEWTVLAQYAERLKNAVDGFDIEQTRMLLRHFQGTKNKKEQLD
ncbi:MAG: tetratricopeptide repeat protein [Bacteroidetes bacterium]|jgi:signal transduction histidine kinase|nr:tetratricopeptide repeat protein [Bacteroidota bacterium]